MKFLKTYWLALILSIAAGVVYAVMGHGLITAAALSIAALSWAGLAAWALPTEAPVVADQLDQSAVREAICTIVDRVNRFIDEEVGILNGSLEQIQALAKDAVGTLGKSMHSLNHQVQRQSKLLHDLAGISGGQKDKDDPELLSIGKYVDDSQSVIRYFIDLLDELGKQRDGYVGSLTQLRDGMAQLRESTAHFSGDNARELRLKVAGMNALADRQAEQLGHSKSWSEERDGANAAVRNMQQTRDKLQGMRDVVAMSVAAFSTQSSKDVGEAIRSLQFEDIVTQLVSGAQGRLDEMNRLVSTLNTRVDHLKVIDTDNEPLGALEVVEQIHTDVVEYTDRLRASRHRPVGQSSLDEGSIELF